MSSVLYTRLSEELKQALADRAQKRGVSLNAAACELIAAGLAASADEHAGERLQRKLAASSSELEQTRARLAEAELRLQAAREREEMSARTYRALAERARGELASCPQCRNPLRGSDLLVSGRCPVPGGKQLHPTCLNRVIRSEQKDTKVIARCCVNERVDSGKALLELRCIEPGKDVSSIVDDLTA